ncbi:hypothetical protein ACR03S_10290 [Limimaricola variabilis]
MSTTPIMIRACRVQDYFGIHRSTLYRWVNAEAEEAQIQKRKPRLKLHKRGAGTFVKAAELEAYITDPSVAA